MTKNVFKPNQSYNIVFDLYVLIFDYYDQVCGCCIAT